ncbi:glutamate 5-kinase [Alteromonadaceae bacterium BrNp21-10]|nr:glutamate 5-kinase [Alteromonadaceae bacterium BrNp21-10]
MTQSAVNWHRAVIKVGSALIAPEGNGCRTEHLLALARFIIQSRENGKEVILVSSGSVAAGRNAIAHGSHVSIAEKQAMAAIGQTRMMANWARLFDFPCAQMLLTHDDMGNRQRYLNIKNTLRELLKNNVLPIINENDTVATQELKFGDNDNLAALVAMVADADTLMICTDVDGLYTANPKTDSSAQLIPRVEKIDNAVMQLAGSVGSSVGTGGMQTKLQAAQKACQQGIQTLIINGHSSVAFEQLYKGQIAGTLFDPLQSRTKAKKHWLKHSLKSKGNVVVDEGAYQAISQRGASLLPAGIVAVNGQFDAGDAVNIEYNGDVFAKGLSLYTAADLQRVKGQKSEAIESILGFSHPDAVLHRDDLVLL